MRQIINISLSKELNKVVEKAMKTGKFSTKSEFFRNLVRRWLSEEKLLQELKESQKEFKAGKGKLLKSLKDLR